PLSGLDRPRKEEILPHLERLRDNGRIPILYVTHNVDEVARLADKVVVLSEGRIAAQASVFDFFADPALASLTGASPGAIISATVAQHHEADGLTELAFEGQKL